MPLTQCNCTLGASDSDANGENHPWALIGVNAKESSS